MRLRLARAFAAAALCCLASPSTADEVTYAISGISDPLLANVRSHLSGGAIGTGTRLAAGRAGRFVEQAEESARAALKPYGYYKADISSDLVRTGPDAWRLDLRIQPGPPVVIARSRVELRGAGSGQEDLLDWRSGWPLSEGQTLNQEVWEERKTAALQIAEEQGYIAARFVRHAIRIDLDNNRAELDLVLDTGEQAVFGTITFHQEVIRPWILENVPRFAEGSAYRPDLVDKLRLDLWQTGYFTDVLVEEERLADETPPVVNVIASMETEFKNTYQGTLGTGTDTGFRTQAMWRRHPLSSRGDRLDLRAGYQQEDDELTVRTDYRIPRRTDKRQYWTASLILRQDRQDLEFKRNEDDEGFITLAPGRIDDLFFRAGLLHVRDRAAGQDQYFETIFAQYLRESYEFDPGAAADPEIVDLLENPATRPLFRDTVQTLSLGVEWDSPAVRGSGFATSGVRDRAWIFTSNEFWGSQRDFTQLYASTRRSYLRGDRWKLLLRAEAGYSDARVDSVDLVLDGEPLTLSITRLPNQYRFKAGGSDSVRGYAFEALSNNDVGSNNIVAASAEIEMRVLERWSVAAFIDAGNAFNDWDDFELRRGVGAGVRWYSVAGPIRLDVGRALDFAGRPWRIHFSIGTPLL